MTLKKDESYSSDIIEIIKGEITIVSFMLFFVTFLFMVNFETKGVFAKPLLLFLASALFILYGIITRISSAIIKKRSSQFSNVFNKISTGFYVLSIILFVLSCDLLLVGIQALERLPEYHKVRIIVMVLGVIPLISLGLSLLYSGRSENREA